MSSFGRGTPFVSQPPYKPSVDPYWLSRGVILATSYGQVPLGAGAGVGEAIENLAGEFTSNAVISSSLSGRNSNEIYTSKPAVGKTTPHGQALSNESTDNNGLIVVGDIVAGLSEFTMLTWFAFNAAAPSKQWMNFRSDNNCTLDIYSQTSSSINWGSDWRTSWTGGSQKTLSGLENGDLVCIASSINSAGARQFHNGIFAGTKSGSAFTLQAILTYPVPGLGVLSGNAAAPGVLQSLGHVFADKALSDDELIYLTSNPWGLFRQRSRMPAPWVAGSAAPLSSFWANVGGVPTRSLGLRAWNGSAVVTPTAKRWTGAAWEEFN